MGTSQHLNDNLHIKKNGSIFIEDDRSILISISAFGTLRRNLIENIGLERMKGFLIRYGWELGQEDARKAAKKDFTTIKEAVDFGPILHRMRGHADIGVTKLETEQHDGKISILLEGTWKDSYEAEEHLRKFGHSHSPVCYTMLGYASGYLSSVCNQMVVFKEISCQAEGHDHCICIGKSLDYWDGEVDDELQFFQESPIVKELELTYEKLLEEKGNLEQTMNIHKKLTEVVLQGKDLQSITEVVYQETATPVLISDDQHHPLAFRGLSSSHVNRVNEELVTYLQRKQTFINEEGMKVFQKIRETKWIHLEQHTWLITPVYLQNKINGYCSFIYMDQQVNHSRIHEMIVERFALVSSQLLQNEVMKFETEQRMMGSFFDEILRGEYHDEEEILRRGSFIQLDLSQSYRIAMIKYQVQENNLQTEFTFHEEMAKETAGYFKNKLGNILVGHRTKSVVVLVPISDRRKEGIETYVEHLLYYLSEKFPDAVFFAGISKEYDKIGEAKASYHEAFTALRMATRKNIIILFDSLGMVGPLINQNNEKEIRRLARSSAWGISGKCGS